MVFLTKAAAYYVVFSELNIKALNRLFRLNHRNKISIRKVIVVVETNKPSSLNGLSGNVIEKGLVKIVPKNLVDVLL